MVTKMKEEEIRPQDLFNRYLEIVNQDIRNFFGDKSRFVETPCPACGADEGAAAFEKLGFNYRTCGHCETLYLSPRPTESIINDYYRSGAAVKFWSDHFYRETIDARREKIYRPRAERVAGYLRSNPGVGRDLFVDIGSGYGVFLQEMSSQRVFSRCMGIEPAPNMAAECRAKGFDVIEAPAEAVAGRGIGSDFATSFEVIEHVYSPENFLRSIKTVLGKDGLLLFTTLTISGFDLQVLWDRSKSIYPPHHINLMSVDGIRALVERCGMHVVELSTPGRLDVDIVANAYRENPQLPLPGFVRVLLNGGDEAKTAFQSFLSEHLLSSHISVIAKTSG